MIVRKAKGQTEIRKRKHERERERERERENGIKRQSATNIKGKDKKVKKIK